MRPNLTESDISYYDSAVRSGITLSALADNKVGLPPQILARFLAKINYVPGACWEWTAAKFREGYGMFYLGRDANGKQITAYAHRIGYELAYGSLGTFQAQHHCDVRHCVRPDHLYAGTQSENMRDRTVRGRYPAEIPKAWQVEPVLRRRLVAECLAAPHRSGTIARLAREHDIPYPQLYQAVTRTARREFLAATTTSMAAHR